MVKSHSLYQLSYRTKVLMLMLLMLLMHPYLVGFEPTTMAVQINDHHLALPLSYRYKYHGLIWFVGPSRD
jgi:hypothetical protein